MTRYWIGVVSREHVKRGVEGGFAQLGHGKHAPLRRLARGDWLVYYSPRTAYPDGAPVRAFTAIGQIADEEATRVAVSEDFAPWRRRVRYESARDVPAADLLPDLEVVPEPRRWGTIVRRGLVEIGRPDFERIATAMLATSLATSESGRPRSGGTLTAPRRRSSAGRALHS